MSARKRLRFGASLDLALVGHSTAPDFATTAGAVEARCGGKGDGLFAMLSPDDSRLFYAIYLRGDEEDLLRSRAIGPEGHVFLVGKTASDDPKWSPENKALCSIDSRFTPTRVEREFNTRLTFQPVKTGLSKLIRLRAILNFMIRAVTLQVYSQKPAGLGVRLSVEYAQPPLGVASQVTFSTTSRLVVSRSSK